MSNFDYPSSISDYIGKMMADIYRAQDIDLRAALAAWDDIDTDPENLFRCEPERGIRWSADMRALEVPTLIVVGEKRHVGTAYPGHLVPVDHSRLERIYVGVKYKVGLLHRAECAKIPPAVREPHTGVIDFIGNMDD
jgi:pimeloyl-ACP methyl ester carboxylesterase